MRNLLKLFIGLAVVSVFAVSCKKDNAKKSTLKIGTTEYELSTGYLLNYGPRGNGYNLDLRLYSDGISAQGETSGFTAAVGSGKLIYFWLTTTSPKGIGAGVYSYNPDAQVAGTFYSAYYYLDYYHTLDVNDKR